MRLKIFSASRARRLHEAQRCSESLASRRSFSVWLRRRLYAETRSEARDSQEASFRKRSSSQDAKYIWPFDAGLPKGFNNFAAINTGISWDPKPRNQAVSSIVIRAGSRCSESKFVCSGLIRCHPYLVCDSPICHSAEIDLKTGCRYCCCRILKYIGQATACPVGNCRKLFSTGYSFNGSF